MASLLRNEGTDVIQSRSMRLTLGSAVGASIVALAAAIEPVFEAVFGGKATPGIRAAVLIAVIAAWTLVAVADLLARGYATAHTRLPGLKATIARATEESGFFAVDFRPAPNDPGKVEMLLVKPGRKPEWIPASDIRID